MQVQQCNSPTDAKCGYVQWHFSSVKRCQRNILETGSDYANCRGNKMRNIVCTANCDLFA